MRRSIVFCIGLFLVVGISLQGQEASISDNAPTLEELALRLLSVSIVEEERMVEPRFLVGQLPQNLPAILPLAEDARLIGSFVNDTNTRIAIDIPQPVDQIKAFYQTVLEAQGWTKVEFPTGGSGFETTVSRFLVMCESRHGPLISVTANAVVDQPSRVVVSINTDLPQSSCSFRADQFGIPRSVIPSLTNPSGSRFMGGGAGLSDDDAHSNISLRTSLDLPSLALHYANQLEDAGWVRKDDGFGQGLVWISWTFDDENGDPWQAVLVAQNKEGHEDEKVILVQADLVL